ncbi:MAG: hypothetical protein WBV94_12640 [Blastocatellia bacterium]
MLRAVQNLSPTYYDYLIQTLKAIAISGKSNFNYLPKKYLENLNILKDRIIRCIYILAIFRGHDLYEEAVFPFLSKDTPFDLPRQVMVSPPRLTELLRAKVVIDRKGFGWSDAFRDLLSADKNGEGSATDVSNSDDMEELEKHLQALIDRYEFLKLDLKKFVDFACRGLPGSIPALDENSPVEQRQTCGWYPKEEPTHPVLFIGSTGTAKSSVMMSGLTTFFAAASSVGASVRSNSADDVSMLNFYQAQYYEGRMPKATETRTRYSVQLTTVSTERPEDRRNFIFTDVPGEMVARSLEKTDTDPVVLNLLKYTEIIVFFFDLATEPIFFNSLYFGQVNESWTDLINHVKALREEKRGNTNQLLLLGKLIEDLRQIRGAGDTKQQVSLLCVVPKADFFAGNKSDETRFLSSFYDELREKKILDSSQLSESKDGKDFSELRSMAAVSFLSDNRAEGGAGENQDLISAQIEVIKLINRKAQQAFQKVGNALGAKSSATDKMTLEKTISVGLLSVIKSTFKNVFLLPVSAQGKPALPENGSVKLDHPPSQKLAEYVFIIPTILALREDYGDWDNYRDSE